jgi:hypothetical protein
MEIQPDTSTKENLPWKSPLKSSRTARHRWLMPVILATGEAEIRRLGFEASLGK